MFNLLVRTYQDWRAPRETAEKLSRLSDEQLRDVGLARRDVSDIARSVRVKRA